MQLDGVWIAVLEHRLVSGCSTDHELLWCRASPPVQLAKAAYQPVQRQADRQIERFAYVYADFTSEETKRKWKWSRQMAQEAKLWRSVVTFLQGKVHAGRPRLWSCLTCVCCM